VTERTVNDIKTYNLAAHNFPTGSLVAVHFKDFPFLPVRSFWVYGCVHDSVARGDHAHYSEHQVLVGISGSVNLKLIDRFGQEKTILLNPQTAVYVPNNIWIHLDCNGEYSALVFSSTEYDPQDYQRDFVEFLGC